MLKIRLSLIQPSQFYIPLFARNKKSKPEPALTHHSSGPSSSSSSTSGSTGGLSSFFDIAAIRRRPQGVRVLTELSICWFFGDLSPAKRRYGGNQRKPRGEEAQRVGLFRLVFFIPVYDMSKKKNILIITFNTSRQWRHRRIRTAMSVYPPPAPCSPLRRDSRDGGYDSQGALDCNMRVTGNTRRGGSRILQDPQWCGKSTDRTIRAARRGVPRLLRRRLLWQQAM